MKLQNEAKQLIQKGINKIASAVCITLGPRGKNVVLDNTLRQPFITNDGVSIAKRVFSRNKYENMAIKLMQEVADKTNKATGDGTTTSIVLSQSLFNEAIKMMAMGYNPVFIKTGLQKCGLAVVDKLKQMSLKVKNDEMLEQIASLSAENKEIGVMVAKMVKEVGETINIEESATSKTETEILKGISFDRGWISPHFITHPEKMTAEYLEANIALINVKMSTIYDLKPIADIAVEKQLSNLIIIADEVIDDSLNTMVVNKMKGNFKFVAVKNPGHSEQRKKEWFDDISAATGAKVINKSDYEQLDADWFGKCQKIIIKDRETLIIGGYGDKKSIEKRIIQLKTIMEGEDDIFKPEYRERIARLEKGVGVIRVGALTEAERIYLKMKVEDAVNATNAAISEGILAGGGMSLLNAKTALNSVKLEEEEKPAKVIMRKALESCIRQLALNSGDNADTIIEKSIGDVGYNFYTRQFENLIKTGIIDPLKVVRCAFENAVSMVSSLLTAECLVEDTKKPEEVRKL